MGSPAGITQCASVPNITLPINNNELTRVLNYITDILKINDYQLQEQYNLHRNTLMSIRDGKTPSRNVLFYYQTFIIILKHHLDIAIQLNLKERVNELNAFIQSCFYTLLGLI